MMTLKPPFPSSISAGFFFKKRLSYKLPKKIFFFDILGFFDEIFDEVFLRGMLQKSLNFRLEQRCDTLNLFFSRNRCMLFNNVYFYLK